MRTTHTMHPLVILAFAFITLPQIAGCGGGGSSAEPGGNTPTVVPAAITKTVVDAALTYPFGFFIVNANTDHAKLFLGNTVGGVISSPTDGSVWTCSTGTDNPQSGEIYTYDLADNAKKKYIMSNEGFIERGTFNTQPDGAINLYFVENRDGHLIKITSNAAADKYIEREQITTPDERPYDLKVAALNGGQADIVYGSHTGHQVTLIKGGTGERVILAEGISETRTIELFQFDGDNLPSILATGLGAAADQGANPGWVVILRNHGDYNFTEHRFPILAAAYARLVALNGNDKSALYLVVTRGLRDDMLAATEHEVAIFKYDPAAGSLENIGHYKLPYAYRFDFKDINQDGVLDIAVGSHDGSQSGSGSINLLLSNNGQVNYQNSVLDTGLVAVNDLKFWTDPQGNINLFAVADNGNGCPRKVGGSRLVKYRITPPLKNMAMQTFDTAS